jgi:hypothetical protein
MKKNITVILISLLIILGFFQTKPVSAEVEQPRWWSVQAIDTVKYSRDVSREKENDQAFDNVIEAQVREIANTGATHVAVGSPYDAEFIPFLHRWVKFARKYNLKVWFRGNFSGWEGWFDYQPISREEHLKKLKDFITSNGDLFENGDIFTSCPECENGGSGDPRSTGDVIGFRNFLIDEYKTTRDAFRLTGKSVITNYYPMNADVAKLIMDKETTKALGGVVVIDHYVDTPDQMASDIKEIANNSGGKIVLGEFGAPIPDIQGDMDETQQANWIDQTLSRLVKIDSLIGLNYWTSVGGSTEIWTENRYAKKGVAVLKKYFLPRTFKGFIYDEAGGKVKGAILSSKVKSTLSGGNGEFSLAFIEENEPITISADGYFAQTYMAQDAADAKVIMVKEKESILFSIRKFFNQLFNKLF